MTTQQAKINIEIIEAHVSEKLSLKIKRKFINKGKLVPFAITKFKALVQNTTHSLERLAQRFEQEDIPALENAVSSAIATAFDYDTCSFKQGDVNYIHPQSNIKVAILLEGANKAIIKTWYENGKFYNEEKQC